MNAKTLAHNIQMGLKLTSGVSVKRSPIHELVASAFGYGSLAALQASDILCEMPLDVTSENGIPKADIARRALALGYSAVDAEGVAAAVAKQIEGANLLPLSLESLLDHLIDGGYDGIADDFPIGDEGQYLDLTSAPVASALTEAAERGDARAHLALAILTSDTWEDSDPDAGRYWFEQGQKGKSLAGVEKEWADSYRDRCEADARTMSHLHAAANMGHPDALLLMAAQHGDKRFFDLHEPVVRAPAIFVAEAAEEAQRTDAMWHWMPQRGNYCVPLAANVRPRNDRVFLHLRYRRAGAPKRDHDLPRGPRVLSRRKSLPLEHRSWPGYYSMPCFPRSREPLSRC